MTSPDPTQTALAAQIVTLLAIPFVQGVAKQVGQDSFTQAKTLLGRVRDRLRQDHNDEALATLDLFQGDPGTFAEALARLLAPSCSRILTGPPSCASSLPSPRHKRSSRATAPSSRTLPCAWLAPAAKASKPTTAVSRAST